MKALVTGYRGYIGSRLACALPHFAGIDQKDGNDLLRADACIPHGTYGTVFHLAALATVSESVRQPLRYWGTNVGTTQALLSTLLCRGFSGRLVFASSLLASQPDSSPYAASKDACERLIRQSVRQSEMSAVILRLANVAGGDRTPGRMWVELQRAVESETSFGVCGEHRAPIRDYVHVLDVVRAFMLAAACPLRRGEVITVDIGTGDGSIAADCLAAAERALGRPIAWHAVEKRPGDIPFSVADPEPAACLLGWRPERTLLDIAREAMGFAVAARQTA